MDGCYLKKISQEHGVVHVTKEFLAHKPVGSIIYLIPVHSCLTANLMKEDTLYLE
jgi:D-serine deaminase-like pyridoxal phosphate-dependent protein